MRSRSDDIDLLLECNLGKIEDSLSELGLRNIDLRLTIEKINIDTTIDLLAVSGGPEDVANSFTLGEGMICNLAFLSAARVGKGNEELSSGE